MGEITGNPTYSCRNCRIPVALGDDLLSKSFVAKSGQAYMFAHAMNVVLGYKEDRELLSGVFTICEVRCCKCGEELGWKYIRAYNPRQMYKEGRFIIEKAKILKEYC
ncbi:Protein yippee-like [Camellia lanceoleosa]|uniref:Protein yippee-like n=1 Tax=Camellia lanceoleosa TaxID=1840588 RepID=A0ACC0ISS7_9ERIC|nr:Protein yippee-like [Camellia lanceoleosa]